MKKILIFILLVLPFTLQAKYNFDETLFIPIEQTGTWKKGKEASSDEGSSLTRYLLETETQSNWSKLLTIQFKDRELVKGNTAEEAMSQEQLLSPAVMCVMIRNLPNDVVYERTFPSGEHELVRMVMTKKGLHRAAYLKRSPFEGEERSLWARRLMSGVVGK